VRYNKILLVNPSYFESYFTEPQLNSGLGYIAQSLEDHSLEYDVMDMNVGYSDRDLFDKVEIFKPDLIGMTMMTYRYNDTYKRINELKKRFNNISIVAGGPHISLFRQRALEECPGIDYGVVLEGEETIIEVCSSDKKQEDIKGLIYRKDGDIFFNGEREFNNELDKISFPKYSKFELEKYPRRSALTHLRDIPVVTSRGCPAQCIFCPVKTSIGQKFRYRSTGSILSELKYWYQKGYRSFWIADDNFTLLKERVLQICSELKESAMKGIVLGCGNGIRADRVDREVLTAMKSAGFKSIAYGIEAGNNKILKILKKGETMESIEKSLELSFELGFSVVAFFLIGSPYETKADIEDSFRLARKYPFNEVRFYHVIPYPETELYEWIKENKYFIYSPQYYLNNVSSLKNRPVYFTPELTEKDRIDIFRKANRLVNNVRINNYSKKLLDMGFPGFAARLAAAVYNTKIINNFINRAAFFRKIKDGVNR
jgi:anaerobic magnesium-protoporphyrin IX monomethyl ester cyclase